jgi:hypothetical protein
MKKGLTLTLMTVAIAMLGFQAMAMAPVIGDIPSPIIGSSTASGATAFVYPDAIDLRNFVTDANTTDVGTLLWSFSTNASASNYAINGVGPIATSGGTNGDATTPGTYQINVTPPSGAGHEKLGPVGNPNSITIRNKTYAPLTGTGATPPSTDGPNSVVASQIEQITFYASDGTTYGVSPANPPVYFYTDVTGANRLSGGASFVTVVPTEPVNASAPHGFVGAVNNSGDPSGKNMSQGLTANGACFTVPLRGTAGSASNVGTFTSALGIIPVLSNQVYRIRVTMNGSQAAVGSTPFWDVNIQNPGTAGSGQASNLFGGDMLILDNEGGANSVISSANGQTFDFWWAPAAIATPQWNDATNGAFSTNYSQALTTQLVFRMLDSDNNGLQAYTRSGSVCMTNLQIVRWDLGTMVVGANDYKIDSTVGSGFVQNNAGGTGNTWLNNAVGTATLSFANGAVTVAPPAGTTADSNQVTNIWPGKDLLVGTQTYSNTTADNNIIRETYPVPWKSNTLYQVTADLAAANSTDAQNMPDAYYIGMSTVSNEANYQNGITNEGFWPGGAGRENVGPGVPTTTASTYMAFYYGQTASVGVLQYSIPASVFDWLRPFVQIINTNAVDIGNGNNTGSTVISKITVNEVTFPGM